MSGKSKVWGRIGGEGNRKEKKSQNLPERKNCIYISIEGIDICLKKKLIVIPFESLPLSSITDKDVERNCFSYFSLWNL